MHRRLASVSVIWSPSLPFVKRYLRPTGIRIREIRSANSFNQRDAHNSVVVAILVPKRRAKEAAIAGMILDVNIIVRDAILD
jgi:hypothetical protein